MVAMSGEENHGGHTAAIATEELADQTRSYLERGRRLQGLTDTQLLSKWVADFRAWRASRSDTDDPGNRADIDDTAAEMRLRDLEPPYDEIQDEVRLMLLEIARISPGRPATPAKVRRFLDDLSKRGNGHQA